jgi:hypothetical protein
MTDRWQISRIGSLPLHLLLVGGLLVLNLFLCFVFMEQQATAWDPLGYQVAGQAIARGLGPITEHPFNGKYGPYFALAAFGVQNPLNPSQMYLNYPPGFPILLAIPQWLGLPGLSALPVLSTLSLVFVYSLGRMLFDRWVGLLGATIVAFTPLFMEQGTSFWADVPGVCFVLGGLTVYLAACRMKKRAGQVVLGNVAGGMFVIATFIKYSHMLALLPVLVYAVYTQRRSMFGSLVNWALVAAVVVGLACVGLYNQAIYGNPLETAYVASRSGWNFPLFSLSYALGPSPANGYNLIAAAKTLWGNFSWLLLAVALGLTQAPRGTLVLLGGMFFVFLALSVTYAWAPQNENARYLLPLFAPVALFAARGCLTVLGVGAHWKKWGLGLILVAVGVTSLASFLSTEQRLAERNRNHQEVRRSAVSLTADSEQDSVFLAYAWNDAVNFFGGRTTLFYRRMNVSDPAEFEETLTHTVARLLRDGWPVYYLEDRQPPFANSLDLLQRKFDLRLWKTSPIPVYRVVLK